VGRERLLAVMALFVGGLALLLTSVGLYGLETQRVTQRTAEIGLRVALGAQRRDVLRTVLREAALFFVVGVPIGLALTAVASRFVGSLLYEISPLDPALSCLCGSGHACRGVSCRIFAGAKGDARGSHGGAKVRMMAEVLVEVLPIATEER